MYIGGDFLAYSFKLPYGLRQEGDVETLIHIAEIKPHESGLRCNCVCPSCGERLQAKLPKTKEDFTPRFTHHNADTCDYATETAIHIKAKEIIENAMHMIIPSVVAEYRSLKKEVSPERKINFDSVVLESRLQDIIPDILAFKKEHPLIIEIKITHGIDDIKLKKIKSLGISAIEIDLSDMDTNFDPDFLYNEIILSTENKYWVYNTVAENEKKNLKKEYLAMLKKQREEELKAEEERKRIEKQNEERKEEKLERVRQLFDENYQNKLKQEWGKEFDKDPIWINAAKWMDIKPQNIPEYINVEIPGEIVFGCDRRVWQAYIFFRYINNKVKMFKYNLYPISVKRIQMDIKADFKGRLIYDLVYTKDIKVYQDIPDLTDVIYSYLKILEKMGYLEELTSGHPFHAKFKILDPDSIYEMRFVSDKMPEYKTIESLIYKKEWLKCKVLIEELLVKYDKEDEINYFTNLARVYNRLIQKIDN